MAYPLGALRRRKSERPAIEKCALLTANTNWKQEKGILYLSAGLGVRLVGGIDWDLTQLEEGRSQKGLGSHSHHCRASSN